jgi:agmatine/peptidylarginine deiminase
VIRLPAEWEQQTGVLVCWPTQTSDWSGNYTDAESAYLAITRSITALGQAYIGCADPQTAQRVAQVCRQAGIAESRLHIVQIPYNDTWTRDYGPISIVDEELGSITWLDFRFNAWGGKYPHDDDTRFTAKFHEALFKNSRGRLSCELVLEGGSIDCDGRGTLLTTSQCLLSETRNPGLGKREMETRLAEYLGISRVLWLDHGHLEGDDTDSHIDTLARFCSPDTIAYVQCTDPTDVHHESLSAMEKQLGSFRQGNGQPYRLVPLPLPTPCFNRDGQRLPATYANFLVLNSAVLVPVYGLDTDQAAIDLLRLAFPAHEMVAINCRALIEQYGSLHCVTMQIL